MKYKNRLGKLRSAVILLAFMAGTAAIGAPVATAATPADNCQGFTGARLADCKACNQDKPGSQCVCYPEFKGGSALTDVQRDSCIACNKAGLESDPKKLETCIQSNPIVKDINTIVNVLTGLVSIVVIGVIIFGGIQYTMAGGNPQAAAAARQRITNGLFALFAFLLTWAFLQWLIPGGV